MSNEFPYEKSKGKFNKKILLAIVPLLLGSYALAQVMFGQVALTANVFQPLVISSPASISFDVFPGDSHSEIVTVDNKAGIDLNATISETVASNPNAILFNSSFNAMSQMVPAHGEVNFTYSITIDPNSPAGTLTVDLNLNRIH